MLRMWGAYGHVGMPFTVMARYASLMMYFVERSVSLGHLLLNIEVNQQTQENETLANAG